MKRVSKVLILVLAVALVFGVTGCGTKKKDNKKALEFKKEYEKLNGKTARYGKPHRTLNIPKDNPMIKITPAEVLEKIEKGETFYLYVGDSLCPWCRSVIETAIKVAKDNDVKEIYYIDFWDDENNEILRDVYEYKDGQVVKTVEETEEYKKMLDLCPEYLGLRNYTIKDDKGNEIEVNTKRFFGPTFLSVKDGEFEKYTDGRSIKQDSPIEKLSDEVLEDMENIFNSFFLNICDDAC